MIVRFTQEYLLRLLEYFPIVGVLGSRQVGKTTLVKEVRDRLKLEVIYINLESTSDLVKLNEPELFFNNNEERKI